jgi:hypothetical protein
LWHDVDADDPISKKAVLSPASSFKATGPPSTLLPQTFPDVISFLTYFVPMLKQYRPYNFVHISSFQG